MVDMLSAVKAVVARETTARVLQVLEKADVPVAPVKSIAESFTDSQGGRGQGIGCKEQHEC